MLHESRILLGFKNSFIFARIMHESIVAIMLYYLYIYILCTGITLPDLYVDLDVLKEGQAGSCVEFTQYITTYTAQFR
jgi:hypothetical protein